MRLPRRFGLLVLTAMMACGVDLLAQTPGRSGTTFKSSVSVVTLSVVVRDRDGRLISNLTRQDFQVLDNGVPRKIVEFRSEPAPISIALLFDVSGSMDGSLKLARVQDAAHQLLSWLSPTEDEAGLFSFDTELRQLGPFEKPSQEFKKAIGTLRPFGATSIRDAIAAAAQRVTERGRPRRAVVVLTDGMDTASRLSAAEVSAAASAIDVPVYVLATVAQVDHLGGDFAVDGVAQAISGDLSDMARWTGGAFFMVSLPSHVSLAVRQIVEELRQQYLIAVEPDKRPGWHPLEVRTRDKRLSVRARSGYFAAS
jgi:Ca-activated chloride channel homolog